jgi:hypothetical protein
MKDRLIIIALQCLIFILAAVALIVWNFIIQSALNSSLMVLIAIIMLIVIISYATLRPE